MKQVAMIFFRMRRGGTGADGPDYLTGPSGRWVVLFLFLVSVAWTQRAGIQTTGAPAPAASKSIYLVPALPSHVVGRLSPGKKGKI